MTGITRPLARESAAGLHSAGRRRAVVIILDPSRPTLIGLRLKGNRTIYYAAIDWLYREAVRSELARQKAERKRLRKERAK